MGTLHPGDLVVLYGWQGTARGREPGLVLLFDGDQGAWLFARFNGTCGRIPEWHLTSSDVILSGDPDEESLC